MNRPAFRIEKSNPLTGPKFENDRNPVTRANAGTDHIYVMRINGLIVRNLYVFFPSVDIPFQRK